ncbi:MAG TPA: CoA pyrophosphatase [Burkholderiaceae bacterium]
MTKLRIDPQLIPVESLAGEAPVAVERLAAAFLRRRFTDAGMWTPEPSDEHLLRLKEGHPTPASVLVPLVLRAEGITVLLTQRSEHLNDHGGQISFPGGRQEASDRDVVETALRETEEEVGLARAHVEVLGLLPEYVTATNYRVTPVVGLVHPPFETRADPEEVAEIFEVPLSFLMDGANHQRRAATFPNGMHRTFYAMPYDRFFIWGATAGMLRNLFHFLRS